MMMTIPIYNYSPIKVPREAALEPQTSMQDKSQSVATRADKIPSFRSEREPAPSSRVRPRRYSEQRFHPTSSWPAPPTAAHSLTDSPPQTHDSHVFAQSLLSPTYSWERPNSPPHLKIGEASRTQRCDSFFLPSHVQTANYRQYSPSQRGEMSSDSSNLSQKRNEVPNDMPGHQKSCWKYPEISSGQTEMAVRGRSASIAHPPGYQQNVYASELNSHQRAAHEQEVRRSSDFGLYTLSDEGVWATAKKLAAGAGEKLATAEYEVWRRINSEDK